LSFVVRKSMIVILCQVVAMRTVVIVHCCACFAIRDSASTEFTTRLPGNVSAPPEGGIPPCVARIDGRDTARSIFCSMTGEDLSENERN
jgi:hypothetical protein